MWEQVCITSATQIPPECITDTWERKQSMTSGIKTKGDNLVQIIRFKKKTVSPVQNDPQNK